MRPMGCGLDTAGQKQWPPPSRNKLMWWKDNENYARSWKVERNVCSAGNFADNLIRDVFLNRLFLKIWQKIENKEWGKCSALQIAVRVNRVTRKCCLRLSTWPTVVVNQLKHKITVEIVSTHLPCYGRCPPRTCTCRNQLPQRPN